MAKIAIVTPDIMGPIANGGVGSAFYFLACHLAKEHSVSILFYPEAPVSQMEMDHWRLFYQGYGVNLELMAEANMDLQGPPYGLRSYQVFLELEKRQFDVVHFADMGGLGHFPTAARWQGVGLKKTKTCVHLHGPTLWHRLGSFDGLRGGRDVELSFLERASVAHADFVVAPSQAMADWVRGQGWQTQGPIKVIPHAALPWRPQAKPGSECKATAWPKSKEILFLGRLEDRKGIGDFFAAARDLPAKYNLTVCGRAGLVNGRESLEFIGVFQKETGREIKLILDYGHLQTLDYLASHKPLVIMPSWLENSPCAVFECLSLGVPFLATDLGGTHELVHPEDRLKVLIAPGAKAIVEAVYELELGTRSALGRLNPEVEKAPQEWSAWHQRVCALRAKSPACEDGLAGEPARVSVCIPTQNRSAFLEQALESLAAQTEKKFEIIIVDDGSSADEAARVKDSAQRWGQSLSIKLIKGSGLGPSLARNLAAKESKAEFLLFMDDDNLAEPTEIETFLRVAKTTGADVLTCIFERFNDGDLLRRDRKSRWLPIGDCRALAMAMNVFGDTNCLVRREVFLKSGGFSPDIELGEDWDLLWRLCEMGAELEVIPQVLFKYRDHKNNRSLDLIMKPLKRSEPLRAFCSRLPEGLIDFVMLGQPTLSPANYLGAPSIKPISTASAEKIILWRPDNKSSFELLEAVDAEASVFDFGLLLQAFAGDPGVKLKLPRAFKGPIEFAAKIYSKTNSSIEVYVETKGQCFHEEDMRGQRLLKGWNEVRVQLSGESLGPRFRLDFGEAAGEYFIDSMGIVGSDEKARVVAEPRFIAEISGWDEQSLSKNQIDLISLEQIVPERCQLIAKNNFLEITADGDDPALMIDTLEREGVVTTWVLDIEVPCPTPLDFFFKLYGQTEFPPYQQVVFNCPAGRSQVMASIYHRHPVRGWRLDPGVFPGIYKIHTLGVVRGGRTRARDGARDRLPPNLELLQHQEA